MLKTKRRRNAGYLHYVVQRGRAKQQPIAEIEHGLQAGRLKWRKPGVLDMINQFFSEFQIVGTVTACRPGQMVLLVKGSMSSDAFLLMVGSVRMRNGCAMPLVVREIRWDAKASTGGD